MRSALPLAIGCWVLSMGRPHGVAGIGASLNIMNYRKHAKENLPAFKYQLEQLNAVNTIIFQLLNTVVE